MNESQDVSISTDSNVTECDSLSTRFQLAAIVDALKARFSDYSDDAPSLATLSPALELETLRQIFNLACRATTFSRFCEELDAFWTSRDAQTKAVDEERRNELVTAQIFNNFVVQILEKRRKIGAAFLKRHIGDISPKVVEDLDFEAYSTEPTVHIFGAQVSRLCDLVFSIPFKDRSEGTLAVAVPMEHKSTQTRNVVFQLLTSLVLVLQYVQRHKERFQRKDKKFVWPFLLLFYTGARPWKDVPNFPELFATPDPTLDKSWIFKLPFRFVSLFELAKQQTEDDPWLDAFLELTKGAERIVANKNATAEDWKKAWNDAFDILKGKIDPDSEEDEEIFGDFVIFVSKFAIRQGWEHPTYEEITYKWEELGGADMTFEINSIADLARISGWKDGRESGWKDGRESGWKDGRESGWKDGRESGWKDGRESGLEEGEQKSFRESLKNCLTLRFPRIAQTTMNNILSIADLDVLKSIFAVACTADSLENFQRDIRGIAPVI